MLLHAAYLVFNILPHLTVFSDSYYCSSPAISLLAGMKTFISITFFYVAATLVSLFHSVNEK